MAGIQHLVGPYLALLAYGPMIVVGVVLSANAWNFYLRFKLSRLDRPRCAMPSAAQPPSR